MKKRTILLLIVIVSAVATSHAQFRPQRSGIAEKIYFGGGGGFSGGTQFLALSLSPLVGYKITDQFSAGLQLTYQYTKFGDATASNYGGGPFLLYAFSQKFFTYSQYEYLNVQPLLLNGADGDRLDFNSLFVGIGYMEPLGGNVAFQITALYNLLYGDGSNSPYQSPLQFRVGIVAGLF